MNTPLQELIEVLENRTKEIKTADYSSMVENNTLSSVIRNAKELLPKEKEVIINARVTAPILPTSDKEVYIQEAEEYYNETFKK